LRKRIKIAQPEMLSRFRHEEIINSAGTKNPQNPGTNDRTPLCYSVLQRVAVCCSVLQCVAVCCGVLQCVAGSCSVCSVLQCVAVRCSALQCVAVRCSVLQCVAVCCSVLQIVIRIITLHYFRKIWWCIFIVCFIILRRVLRSLRSQSRNKQHFHK